MGGWRGGSFALLYIHSTRFRAKPISVRNRLKNFFNTLGYDEDRAALTRYGLTRFFGGYLRCCQLSEKRKAKLLGKLKSAAVFPELKRALRGL